MFRLKPRRVLAALLALVLAVGLTAWSVRELRPDILGPWAPRPDVWEPSLIEDFDVFDSGRWVALNETYRDNEDSFLLADNVSVDGGVLRIQAKPEARGGRDYTSGNIQSHGYSLPDHFRIEIRAKVPFQQGLWAAPLWLRPVDHSGGEIDLVETYGSDRDQPKLRQSIHTDYGDEHDQRVDVTAFEAISDKPATDWHVYTLEKTPQQLTMWVDGIETASFDASDIPWYAEYYEAGKTWELRINLQVGGTFGGLPDSSTDWAPDFSQLQVDWIRTWVPAWSTPLSACPSDSSTGCLPLTNW